MWDNVSHSYPMHVKVEGYILKLNCNVHIGLKYMNMRSDYLLSGMTPWKQDILKILQ